MASRLLLASNNPGKLGELRRILEPLGVKLVCPSELGLSEKPEETGKTFLENALQKARFFARRTGLQVIADDSGLCVDALDGAPGVHSARFAGKDATDEKNNRKLLDRLAAVPEEKRGAHFFCAAVCVLPDGRFLESSGRTEGRILFEGRGGSGFGYDPVFLEPESGKTFAELEAEAKDAISHRGKAFRELAARLPDFLRGFS